MKEICNSHSPASPEEEEESFVVEGVGNMLGSL